MTRLANEHSDGMKKVEVGVYDATDLLCAPFSVILKNSVSQVLDDNGDIVETIIPDPHGLLKAVANTRVLHSRKLSGVDLKFLRSALAMKSKELAEAIGVTNEHMSRLETGGRALSPQSEMLVRIFTFISTCDATKASDAKGSEVVSRVGEIFGKLHVKPCRAADEPLSFTFVRVYCDEIEDHSPDTDDGLWDEDDPQIAA